MQTKRTRKLGDIVGRHGDVGLELAALPEMAIEQPRNGDILLALGEVTGHAHRIAADQASIWVVGGEKYLVTQAPCELTHEEHGMVVVPAGVYRIAIEEDYVPGAAPTPVLD